ncbi:hypothetical protein D9Q98_004976 [Chlorella vulgaris]|uniref:Pyrrolo-quinoline quinone repeat domain-containing protein n=1 Tax=Chlorella vulgaris TaxID=3077 RepID=A0A9D4TND2_CHLVU|nr:hypothetical protein D9Q98_004976 [Chlorella vulgaris]
MLGRTLTSALLLAFLCRSASATITQWNATGEFVNFPFGSPYPPYVLRTEAGSDPDKILVVTGVSGSTYTLTAYDAATGAANYTFTVSAPNASNSELSTVTSGLPPVQQYSNTLRLLFMQMGEVVVALDPSTGQQLWAHPTYNQSTPTITGYSGDASGGTVYLTSAFIDTSRPVPTPQNYIEALDASTGAVRWANFTLLPPTSGIPTSDTAAAYGVTAMPDMAVYAQGPRLYALSAANGSQLWSIAVSTGASFGGASTNVSSVTYVEPAPPGSRGGTPAGLLLLQSTTFEQMRFMAYEFNASAPRAAPSVAWQNRGNQDFEGALNDGLARLGMQVPSVSLIDSTFLFWSNRTSFDINNGGKPLYTTYMVGRSVIDGSVAWATSMNSTGWSQLPVSRPVAHLGVAAFVTGKQVVVVAAAGGGTRFVQNEAPFEPQAAGGQYSYQPLTTFANNVGQLVAVRCVGSKQPGSLCAYNGYDAAMPTSAARPRLRLGGGTHAALLAVLLGAASCLALL